MTARARGHIRWLIAAVTLCLLAIDLAAQPTGGWPGRTRYADGRFSLTLHGGATKYFGEFSDQLIGPAAGIDLRFAISQYVDFGIGGSAVRLRYLRRHRRQMGGTYEYQFGDRNDVERSTDVLSGMAWLRLNLFPAEWMNAHIRAGGGVLMFRPQDYGNGEAAFPGDETILALSIPLGAGLEWYLSRNWSVQFAVTGHLVMSAELDAFDSGRLVELMASSQKGIPPNPDREKTANDSYLTLSLGMTWYLFDDHDYDGDALSNTAEADAGTNPHDEDTDGDGLNDFEEVRIHLTNPLLWDSDKDVLSDFVEVTRYRTDPLKADTDGDGLSDREELLEYKTDPLDRDTEDDGLIDAEEKRLGCNPKKVDTDGDGLYDGDEVIIHHTNPVLPDSDGEGVNDHDEVRVYRTDPNNADCDEDGLTDYEEIRLFRTDPLKPDTDDDGVSDYDELRRYRTDPLKAENGRGSSRP